DAEEAVAHRLGFGDGLVGGINFDSILLGADVNPTSLATQIATVDHRHVQKRGKKLTAFETPFVLVDTP
ncbi:MAG: hypothetical protein P1U77_25585, partial [Rubripirellula sp.]|nr:hypothetical protein [Rubripirellula sp.]